MPRTLSFWPLTAAEDDDVVPSVCASAGEAAKARSAAKASARASRVFVNITFCLSVRLKIRMEV
jgi:hypothetical protein